MDAHAPWTTPRGVDRHAARRQRERYFRWSHAPSGIHLARLVVNSSGHTVTSWPVLPLEHVVLHARVGVLAGLVELHAPAVDPGADRQVQRHDRGAELVEVVGLRSVEHELQEPQAAAGELMPACGSVRAGPGLHGLAERALDPLALGLQLLDDQARAGLEQRERAVAVVAERLAEVGRAVAGRARVHERLELEVLLARLPPEEDGVLVARDVVQDVGVRSS